MIVFEHQVRLNPESLSKVWNSKATFAILSEHSNLSKVWVNESLQALPEHLKTGHILVATSGSTGMPKLLVANRIRAEQLAHTISIRQNVDVVKNMIISLPVSYSFALVNQWVLAHTHSIPMHFARFAEPKLLVETLRMQQASMICLVDTQTSLLAQLGSTVFPKVLRIAFAGSAFPWGQAKLLLDMFPNAEFYDNYGCAEAMPRLTIKKVNDAMEDDRLNKGGLGETLSGISLRRNEDSELAFKSPYSALGYISPDGYTSFDDQWIGTGDCATQGDDGRWYLSGRKDDVFKRHGEKISVAQLRATLESVWDQPFAFVSATDRSGEKGILVFLQGMVEQPQLRKLLHAIRDNHPRAYWPLKILRLDEIPRLENGKVNTKALSEISAPEEIWNQRV